MEKLQHVIQGELLLQNILASLCHISDLGNLKEQFKIAQTVLFMCQFLSIEPIQVVKEMHGNKDFTE